MKKKIMLITVGLTIPFLFACSESEVDVPVTSISLDRTELTLNIGEETTLKATAKPKEAVQEFKWESAEKNAVYVVGGKLHAYSIPSTHDEGGDYTTITVSSYAKEKKDIKTATCKVYVTNIPHDSSLEANGIILSESMVELSIGDTKEVTAKVTPTGLVDEDKEVEWTCSDDTESVVQVHEDFQPSSSATTIKEMHCSQVTITAVNAGTAVLTARDKKTGEFSGQCAIKVNPDPEVVHVESIKFSEDALYIEQGKTGVNNLEIKPYGAENKEITYESSNTAIATVTSDGTVLVKADATIGATATITATSVDNPSATDSFTVTVSEHHSDYLFINRVSDPGWKAFEMSLKDGDDSEYHIASIDLEIGDEFVFCTGVDAGNEQWHHFAQIKDGTGSAKSNFSDKDGNILCARGGEYEIYVQSDPSECDYEGEGEGAVMKSIWMVAKTVDPLPDLTMTVIHNGTPAAPVTCGHVGSGENEFGVENQLFEAGDEVIFNYGSINYGFNELKDGGAKAVISQGTTSSNHIKFDATLTFSLYVDLGGVEHGKRIHVAANYIQKYTEETKEWSYADISVNTEETKENEFVAADVELKQGDKVLFNVANAYYKFADIKPTCELKDVELIGDDDGNIYVVTPGSYTFYVMTPNAHGHEVGIWVTAEPVPVAAQLLVKDGSPIELVPKSMTEYDVLAQTLAVGTEFVASIDGTVYSYEDLKTAHEDVSGGASALFSEGSEYETGKHYLRVTQALKYDIYVNTLADDFDDNIFIAANYIQKYTAETGEWSYVDVATNTEETKENEYVALGLELEEGDKVLFNVANAYYKFNDIKAACELKGNELIADDYDNIHVLTPGTYSFYVMTPNSYGHEVGIWATAVPKPVASQLLVKDGSPIDLSAKSMTEYDVLAEPLAVNTEFVATINGTIYAYEDLKTAHEGVSGGASNLFSEGSEYVTGKHYLKVTQALKYDIYVNTLADGFGDNIYITADYMMVYTSEWTYRNIEATDSEKPTEFVATGVSLSYNNKVLFFLNDQYYHYSNLKTDSRIYSTFSSDGDGNIVIRNNASYDFYVETADGAMDGDTPRQTIWTSCPAEANPTYSLNVGTGSPYARYLNDGATLYAYAFKKDVGQKWIKGTVEGEGTNKKVLFVIPGIYDKAAFVRVNGTITNVDDWSGINAIPESNQWERTVEGQDIILTGLSGGISFNLVTWH